MWLFRLRNRMIGHSRVSWDPILTHTHRWYDFFREIWDDFEAPNWQYTVTWNEVNQTSPKWVPAVSCGFSRNFQGFPFYLLAFKIQISMHQRWKEMPKWCSICCCPHLWSTLTHIHLQDFSFWVKEWFMVHIHWMINHALFFTNEPEPFFWGVPWQEPELSRDVATDQRLQKLLENRRWMGWMAFGKLVRKHDEARGSCNFFLLNQSSHLSLSNFRTVRVTDPNMGISRWKWGCLKFGNPRKSTEFWNLEPSAHFEN